MTDNNLIIDMKFSLSQLSGNRELLLKMFDRFCNDYAPFADELEELIAKNEFQEIRHKVHTIKGVAGNLGMNALHAISKEFEDAAKRSDPDTKIYLRPFQEKLSATLLEIQNLKDEEDKSRAAGGASELKRLLQENEFISNEQLAELLADSELTDIQKAQVSQAVNDLDYPTALSLL